MKKSRPSLPDRRAMEPIGGSEGIAESEWFTARPSGTENIYEVYPESIQRGEP